MYGSNVAYVSASIIYNSTFLLIKYRRKQHIGQNALLMFTLGLIFLDQSAKEDSYALYYVNQVKDYFL